MIKKLFLIAILMLTLVGCGNIKQEQLTVYSFSGENEQFSISNGVIVLDGTEEIFSGGDLKVVDNFFTDITSFTTTFYIMAGNEENVILSNSVTDMTGATISVPNDLGQVSGDIGIRMIKTNDTNSLKNNLYFELTTVDKTGEETTYSLQLSLSEITKGSDDK